MVSTSLRMLWFLGHGIAWRSFRSLHVARLDTGDKDLEKCLPPDKGQDEMRKRLKQDPKVNR
jgi:hypothetical protein